MAGFGMSAAAARTRSCALGKAKRSLVVRKLRILVVDDDLANLAWVAEALSTLGYHVIAMGASPLALQHMHSGHDLVDLVLTDLNMPSMDGMELCQMLLETHPALPILLMTGGELGMDEQALFDKGFKSLLRKPFSITDLETAIHAVLEK